MPRKYHRPPTTATKRRKTRKIPYEFEAAPVERDLDEAEAPLDIEPGWEAETLDTAEEQTAIAVEERELRRAGMRPRDAHERAERHVRRDYSYVKGEVIRIVAIGGLLVITLIVIALLR